MELLKVAIGCQGGGMHAAFEVGVLTEILGDFEKGRFELVGLSGTSAGALCTLMAWYGLARKNGRAGSVPDAIESLNSVWDDFTARTPGESILNLFSFYAFRMRETEVLGMNAPAFGLDPSGIVSRAVTACLPLLGIRQKYYDLEDLLAKACPEFDRVDWCEVETRLLIGASEIINGYETVFDSEVNKEPQAAGVSGWRKRMPLSLRGVAASGTLPEFCEAVRIGGGYYWDGLYSQNPPVREFLSGVPKEKTPDELWILRINPQQWPELPTAKADIVDRENELMGNLSLNKELDFVLTVNGWIAEHEALAEQYKHVTVRTIKMKEETADELRYSSKFDRRLEFTNRLRDEGRAVARDWLDRWPNNVGCYPDDAAYRARA